MPVKPGICRNITLADGTVVKAELVGDEHLTYWRTADGACYRQTPSAGVFSKVELSALQSEYDAVVAQKAAREKAILESARTSMPAKKVEGSKFKGKEEMSCHPCQLRRHQVQAGAYARPLQADHQRRELLRRDARIQG